MTLDQLVEAGARAIAPRRWEVMDAYLEQTKRKYAGQHVGWPADQFKDKESMAQFRAAILAILPLLADDLAGVVDAQQIEEPDDNEDDAYNDGVVAVLSAIRTRLTTLENER